MNRWGLMSALALAAALLLAGCGGDYGLSDDDSADEPQITLEQRRDRVPLTDVFIGDGMLFRHIGLFLRLSAAHEQQRGGKCEGTH